MGFNNSMQPPIAKKRPHELVAHGDTRIDEYFWLRDKTNPEVRAYGEAENAYTAAWLESTKELQDELFQEMKARVPEVDMTVPVKDGPYAYYSRLVAGKLYKIHCRRRVGTTDEEVLLDENEIAEGRAFFSLGIFEVSPDHTKLAYGIDEDGAEVITVYIKDLERGIVLPDALRGAAGSLAWYSDNRTFLYSVRDEALRSAKIFRHVVGTTQDNDTLVYDETDERFSVTAARARSGGCLMIHCGSKTSTEERYVDADDVAMAPKVIWARRPDIQYFARHHGEHFFIMTNERSVNYHVVRIPMANSSDIEDIVPPSERCLHDIDVFASFIALEERLNGLPNIRIIILSKRETFDVAFPEAVFAVRPHDNDEFVQTHFRFTYSSLVTPPTVVDYAIPTRSWTVRKVREVLGGYDPTQFAVERIFATAHDGTSIPVSLAYKKDITRPAPLFLYGYGSYGIPIDVDFNDARISLLERGFIVAIAHIRGGGEYGDAWYKAGKFLDKKTTFTDFIRCAEQLVASGYTKPERLVACGRSAGGLLMGAVANMRPDLFAAIVTEVPFVDCLTTMLDPTIPLTIPEYEEWGNPKNKEYYEYMKSYSPYDNVAEKAYPPMLVESGWNDSRVQYWEPTKWVARLRAMKTDANPLLLFTTMEGGHFGASGRYEPLKKFAREYVFILRVLG